MSDSELKGAHKVFDGPNALARLATTSHKLWGRSLVAEREARVAKLAPQDAGARTLQALRGHITRRLLTELEETTLRRKTTRTTGR